MSNEGVGTKDAIQGLLVLSNQTSSSTSSPQMEGNDTSSPCENTSNNKDAYGSVDDSDNSHHDYSGYNRKSNTKLTAKIDGGWRESRIPFPVKLHLMLGESESDEKLRDIIHWKQNGVYFHVEESKLEELLACWFKQVDVATFQRNLENHGFKRVSKGDDGSSYYHEYLIRGYPRHSILINVLPKGAGIPKGNSGMRNGPLVSPLPGAYTEVTSSSSSSISQKQLHRQNLDYQNHFQSSRPVTPPPQCPQGGGSATGASSSACGTGTGVNANANARFYNPLYDNPVAVAAASARNSSPFSSRLDTQVVAEWKKSRIPFPIKLYLMLSEIEGNKLLEKVISWQPHGRCFVVHKKDDFLKHVLPSWYKQSDFPNFRRQLDIYGFKRITQGRDVGGYWHECFLRGQPRLAILIKGTPVKGTGTRKPSSPDKEPDFYKMEYLPKSTCFNGKTGSSSPSVENTSGTNSNADGGGSSCNDSSANSYLNEMHQNGSSTGNSSIDNHNHSPPLNTRNSLIGGPSSVSGHHLPSGFPLVMRNGIPSLGGRHPILYGMPHNVLYNPVRSSFHQLHGNNGGSDKRPTDIQQLNNNSFNSQRAPSISAPSGVSTASAFDEKSIRDHVRSLSDKKLSMPQESSLPKQSSSKPKDKGLHLPNSKGSFRGTYHEAEVIQTTKNENSESIICNETVIKKNSSKVNDESKMSSLIDTSCSSKNKNKSSQQSDDAICTKSPQELVEWQRQLEKREEGVALRERSVATREEGIAARERVLNMREKTVSSRENAVALREKDVRNRKEDIACEFQMVEKQNFLGKMGNVELQRRITKQSSKETEATATVTDVNDRRHRAHSIAKQQTLYTGQHAAIQSESNPEQSNLEKNPLLVSHMKKTVESSRSVVSNLVNELVNISCSEAGKKKLNFFNSMLRRNINCFPCFSVNGEKENGSQRCTNFAPQNTDSVSQKRFRSIDDEMDGKFVKRRQKVVVSGRFDASDASKGVVGE